MRALDNYEGAVAMKKYWPYILGVVLLVVVLWGSRRVFRLWVNHVACYTEERLKIDDPTGIRFSVEYTNCDIIAKQEDISVYAQTTKSDGGQASSSRKKQRTLLFSYDPVTYDSPLPSITRPSQSVILISIPRISEVLEQEHKFGDITVLYDIKEITYPSSLSSGAPK